METAVAVALLAALVALTSQIVIWRMAERSASQRRQLAVQEAANLLERLAAEPWDRIAPEHTAGLKLSEAAQEALAGAELKIEVAPVAEEEARRIEVEIRWRTQSGEFAPPVRVVAWRWKAVPARER